MEYTYLEVRNIVTQESNFLRVHGLDWVVPYLFFSLAPPTIQSVQVSTALL